jgi:hypothetical protein
MVTGLVMEKMVGCVVSLCVSKLVRRDGVDWYSIAKMVKP